MSTSTASASPPSSNARSASEAARSSKPADPLLEQGRDHPDPLRTFGVPRWVGVLLYALSWFVLLIPLLRRWRRRPGWNWARLTFGLAGLAAFTLAAAHPGGLAHAPRLAGLGSLAVLFALFIGRTADPDAERKLQRRNVRWRPVSDSAAAAVLAHPSGSIAFGRTERRRTRPSRRRDPVDPRDLRRRGSLYPNLRLGSERSA